MWAGMRRSLPIALLALFATACLAAQPGEGFSGPYDDHTEMSDFALLRGGTFDRHDVMSDGFFTNTDLLTADEMQGLLENTPYGRRCFLADETVGGRRVADVLVETARREGLNPLLLLARMQVEKSLISQSTSPGGNRVSYAFGCGCPDGRACNPAYKGLDRQIECGARTHMRLFRASQDGSGGWRQGHTRRSLDPLSVTPANHATAALYAYTPWVLQGRGGNWLVWNVTNRFVDHLIRQGVITEEEVGGGEATERRWIGSACEAAEDCALGLEGQTCHPTGQLCVARCEGYCPDRSGFATTFCVSLDGGSTGTCLPKAAPQNGDCGGLPGTEARSMERFIGSSSARAATATVCAPRTTSSDPMPDPEPDPGPSTDPLCNESCATAGNGVCDDGGEGSSFSDCALGSDCADCGMRSSTDAPAGGGTCENTCRWARDGECDDGGPGSLYSVCDFGTDCADCGAR